MNDIEKDLFAYVIARCIVNGVSNPSYTKCSPFLQSIESYANSNDIKIDVLGKYVMKWVELGAIKMQYPIVNCSIILYIDDFSTGDQNKEYKEIYDLICNWIKARNVKKSDLEMYESDKILLINYAKAELERVEKYGSDYTITDLIKYEYPSIFNEKEEPQNYVRNVLYHIMTPKNNEDTIDKDNSLKNYRVEWLKKRKSQLHNDSLTGMDLSEAIKQFEDGYSCSCGYLQGRSHEGKECGRCNSVVSRTSNEMPTVLLNCSSILNRFSEEELKTISKAYVEEKIDEQKTAIVKEECNKIDLRLIPTLPSMLNRFSDEELKMSYKEFVEHRFKQRFEEAKNEQKTEEEEE